MTITRYLPVVSEETTSTSQVTITSAYGSAGQAITSATPTDSVFLKNWNSPRYGIEYKVGSGAWISSIGPGMDAVLTIDLSTTTLMVRRSENSTSPIIIDVEMNPKGVSDPTLIVISSEAPSDADGRPDGTIYIQTA